MIEQMNYQTSITDYFDMSLNFKNLWMLHVKDDGSVDGYVSH